MGRVLLKTNRQGYVNLLERDKFENCSEFRRNVQTNPIMEAVDL